MRPTRSARVGRCSTCRTIASTSSWCSPVRSSRSAIQTRSKKCVCARAASRRRRTTTSTQRVAIALTSTPRPVRPPCFERFVPTLRQDPRILTSVRFTRCDQHAKLRTMSRAARAAFVLQAQGRTIPLSPGSYVVGRVNESDIVFDDDPKMSRRHVRLVVSEDAVEVEDLGSTNGTWVDSYLVQHRLRVTRPSRLRMGNVDASLEPA